LGRFAGYYRDGRLLRDRGWGCQLSARCCILLPGRGCLFIGAWQGPENQQSRHGDQSCQ
jgi:hypothetical protein